MSLETGKKIVFFPTSLCSHFSSSLLWPSLRYLQSYCYQVLFTEKVQISEKVHAGSDRKVQFSFIYYHNSSHLKVLYIVK